MHHDDFGGLDRDLKSLGRVLKRRDMIRVALGATLLPFLGCNDSPTGNNNIGECDDIPEETAGPFPGDGSNGPNVLNLPAAVRSDIRTSFGGLTGTADGIPLSVRLRIVSAGDCVALPGYAVYLWHCDRPGRYSLYSSGATNQNYLRGIQAADSNGEVTFSSIFPGCYAGRWPHIHFEVYQSLAAATSVGNKIATSQLALPKSACDAVYATTGYEASVSNLAQTSLASDNVFGEDDGVDQIATMTGGVMSGYVATLTVPV